MDRRFAPTVITRMIRMRARRMATTAQNGLWATCSSAQARGITGITAIQVGTGTDTMAGAGVAAGIETIGVAAASAEAGIMTAGAGTGITIGGAIMMVGGTTTADFEVTAGFTNTMDSVETEDSMVAVMAGTDNSAKFENRNSGTAGNKTASRSRFWGL